MMSSVFKVIAEELIRKIERLPCSEEDRLFGLSLLVNEIQDYMERKTRALPDRGDEP